MVYKNTLKGIGLFQLELLHLISIGKSEEIGVIEQKIDDEQLIEYIYNKYKNDFFIPFDNSIYDNKQLNNYFKNYTGYIEGNEARKYGIMNDNDGLLLIISLISDEIEYHANNMTANDSISQ